MTSRPLRWTLAALLFAGCGGESSPMSTPDASADAAGMDAALDGAPEAAVDATPAPDRARPDVALDGTLPAPPIVVGSVPWNDTGMDLGAVAALAEQGEALVLFGARGMQFVAGGTVAATDGRVTMWRTAAVIPAGDGAAGDWVVGVDTMGRVWRVRDNERLEEVTGRYALMMRDARSVARLSRNRVAFGLPTGVAVADGMRVTVWADPSFQQLVGAGSRLAARTAAGVRVFDVDAMRFADFALAGVTGVAFGADGRLVVTTNAALYTENERGELILRQMSTAALRGLTQAAGRTWLVSGNALALWDGTDIRLSTDVTVPMDARLLPALSGDVWVLAAGRLSRYGIVESPDLQLWIQTVRPVFARRCTPCHLPGGTGNLDLTTYRAWVMNRMLVNTQVFVEENMPPPPGMLTADERTALMRWLAAPPPPDAGADARVDATPDAAMDAAPDAAADVAMDARPDVAMDARPDAVMDAAMDARPDAVMDAAMDARPDTATDARPDTATDARPDTATDAAADAGVTTYAAVNTIFQAACVRCHGTSGGLNLSNPTTAYTALVNTPAAGGACAGGGRVRVVPGNPNGSLLYQKLVMSLLSCGNLMPRGGTLTAAQINTVRDWIADGALR